MRVCFRKSPQVNFQGKIDDIWFAFIFICCFQGSDGPDGETGLAGPRGAEVSFVEQSSHCNKNYNMCGNKKHGRKYKKNISIIYIM